MRLLLRVVLSAVILVGAWLAARVLVVQPFRCNQIRQRVTLRTERLGEMTRFRMFENARENVREIRPCLDSPFARTAQDYLLLADNERALGKNEGLVGIYEAALRHDERPEIHYYLAVALLENFRRDDARRHLVLAGYSGAYINEFPDVELRNDVETELARYKAGLRARAGR